MNKSKLNLILVIITVLSLLFSLHQYYIFHIAYEQMPELSCHHLSSSYWQRGKRFTDKVKGDEKSKVKLFSRYSAIAGEIYGLCELDFTNDASFTDYPQHSALKELFK
ncbi:hypothetical protein BH09PAT2_BH09PAT2_04490 [soil metagenome]